MRPTGIWIDTQHQGIADQSHNVISSHICWNGFYWKNQKTARVGEVVEKLEPLHTGSVAMENNMEIPQKTASIKWSCNPICGYLSCKTLIETRRGRSHTHEDSWAKQEGRLSFLARTQPMKSQGLCLLQLSLLRWVFFLPRKMVSFSCVGTCTWLTLVMDPQLQFYAYPKLAHFLLEKYLAFVSGQQSERVTVKDLKEILADSLHHNSQRHKSAKNPIIYYYCLLLSNVCMHPCSVTSVLSDSLQPYGL